MLGYLVGLAFIACFCYLWFHLIRAAFVSDSRSRHWVRKKELGRKLVDEIEGWMRGSGR